MRSFSASHLHARIVAQHGDAPRRPRAQPLQDLDRRRLPRAVRPEQPEHLALAHLEVDAPHRLEIAVRLPQPFHRDRVPVVRHRPGPMPRPPVSQGSKVAAPVPNRRTRFGERRFPVGEQRSCGGLGLGDVSGPRRHAERPMPSAKPSFVASALFQPQANRSPFARFPVCRLRLDKACQTRPENPDLGMQPPIFYGFANRRRHCDIVYKHLRYGDQLATLIET